MRYVFLLSFVVHCVFAFSLKHNTTKKHGVLNNIPVTFISLVENKKNTEPVNKPAEGLVKAKNSAAPKESHVSKSEANGGPTATVIHGEQPVYPEEARINGHEAEFIITLSVDTLGNVEKVDIKTLRGDFEKFKNVLTETFKSWKFSTSLRKTKFSLPIAFLLDE